MANETKAEADEADNANDAVEAVEAVETKAVISRSRHNEPIRSNDIRLPPTAIICLRRSGSTPHAGTQVLKRFTTQPASTNGSATAAPPFAWPFPFVSKRGQYTTEPIP